MICALCSTEHGPHQAHRFASDTRPAVVANSPALVANKVANTPMVANKPKPAMVANTSRHGQYADKARRRESSRAYMAAWRAKRKAGA